MLLMKKYACIMFVFTVDAEGNDEQPELSGKEPDDDAKVRPGKCTPFLYIGNIVMIPCFLRMSMVCLY